MRTSCCTVTKARPHNQHECCFQVGDAFGLLCYSELADLVLQPRICAAQGSLRARLDTKKHGKIFSCHPVRITTSHPLHQHTVYLSKDIIITDYISHREFSNSMDTIQ